MIITDDFVMLNFPKTGSSFSRAVLRQLYKGRNIQEIMLPEFGIKNPYRVLNALRESVKTFPHVKRLVNPHGVLRQIPKEHKDKPVITVTRSPFSRYTSAYLYKWWARHPPVDKRIIIKKYPHFPNLSFAEYYDMVHEFGRERHLRNIIPDIDLGLQSIQFINFYFQDPEYVLAQINDSYIDNELYKDTLDNIIFIHQENLNSELTDFLLNIGFQTNELEFINSMKKINVSKRPSEKNYSDKLYFQSDIKRKILDRDKLLFKIFPEYLPAGETID